jgi:hypothetical protein
VQDAIAPVDNVALGGDKNVFALGPKTLFRFSRPVGKAKELERESAAARGTGGGT